MARSFLLSTALLALRATAQSATPYTDDKSGITFNGYQHTSGFKFGLALPENPTTDFIAQIVGPVTEGWAGFSVGSSMRNNLIVVAWPNEGEVVSSFRKATGYTSPPVVEGDFTMSTIPDGTYVNDTAFSYTFLCKNCIGTDALQLSDTNNVFGWAMADTAVTDPTSASSALSYHQAGFGAFGVQAANAKSAEFDAWSALAVEGSGSGSGSTPGGNSTTPIAGGKNTTAIVSNSTYDYIVAGAGPAGIIVAQRLVESGASVLLLERGGASLAFTGNNDTMSWNSSVSMYDIPGYAYYLSQVGSPAFCTDTADQAGCLLGGGTMVNALMFVRPQEKDFDAKWPAGWKWADVAAAADRLYERNPGQTYGSEDGVRYDDGAYTVLSQFLSANGFQETDSIEKPNDKLDFYSRPAWSLANGMRSGPVRTYLPLAQAESNFKLELNTKVIRAVREGSAITGVEVETSTGQRVIYNVNQGGSVILSAGAMSTPRILFNSGIGPAEQLQTVASGSSGVTLPDEADWIDLPVGAEIKDHIIFTVKFNTSTPMSATPATEYTTPNDTTVDLFDRGSGLLAQSGQRLNFWTAVNTTDGNQVYVQATCNGPAENQVQMKIYLTHGLTSVGSLGITADGATTLTKEPWLTTDTDIEAATSFMDRLLKMASGSNSTLTVSGGNVTGADLIKEYKTGAHFVGTAKMGTKGDAGVVVDTDTKVYGTDNLFVVDASMHPDLPTGNTQAIVMVAAEAAAARILAVGGGSVNGTAEGTAASTGLPVGTSIAQPSGTGSPALPTSAVPTNAAPSAAPTEIPSEAPSVPSSVPSQAPSEAPAETPAPQPTKKPEGQNGGNSWWQGCWGCNKRGEPTTLETRPSPTPVSRRHKRRAVGKVPVSPDSFDDENALWERAQREKASFLDAYNY